MVNEARRTWRASCCCSGGSNSPSTPVNVRLRGVLGSPRPPDSCPFLGRVRAGQAVRSGAKRPLGPLEARVRGQENGQQGDGEPRPTRHAQQTSVYPGERCRPAPQYAARRAFPLLDRVYTLT